MTGSRRGESRQTATVRGRADGLMLIIAGFGVMLTIYLTYAALSSRALAFCAVGSGCDVVATSRYSRLLGLPIAAWGAMTYAALAICAWRLRGLRRWKAETVFTALGFSISVYLTIVGVFELKATCAYCLVSLGLWTGAFALTWREARSPDKTPWRITSVGLAAVVVMLLHLNYKGVFDPAAGPEDPYQRDLALALAQSGAKFYGAYWCPHCQQQKALFGAAAARLPYVECSPNGAQSPQATACVAAEIKGYPTWIINGSRYRRTLSLKQLAAMIGAAPPAAP